MNIVGVIPARYQSSRLPGKPLVDICGKPMIWWTYQRAKAVNGFSEIYIALDDDRVANVCKQYNMKYVMTSNENKTHINRIYEFSQKINADIYAVICGDEPYIKSEVIEKIIPDDSNYNNNIPQAWALKRLMTNPAEVIDPNNIKIVTDKNGNCLYLSRSPMPFPFKTVLMDYYKIVGIEGYNKAALEFFHQQKKGNLEKIEDIALLRFIEYGFNLNFKLVDTDALSVDTEKDLEKIRILIQKEIESGAVSFY